MDDIVRRSAVLCEGRLSSIAAPNRTFVYQPEKDVNHMLREVEIPDSAEQLMACLRKMLISAIAFLALLQPAF